MHLDCEMAFRSTSAWRARFAPALYTAALFLSALLLFAVQPMFAKMVLPRIGGAAAVWSVAMVFFQTALLLGYAYAHLLGRLLSPALSALVHLGLLAVAATTLPIGIVQGFEAAPHGGLELWLLALFAGSIGLPFVALAANAPLLQNWFAMSGHSHAANPYVLYAASNLGSFVALMSYPFIVEPLSALHTQTAAWSIGYLVLMLLIAAAAVVVARVGKPSIDTIDLATVAAPTIAQRTMWTVFAAIPAGLVIAVTAAISTDLAAAPFLWVVPLSLYLLTFVAIFRDRPWVTHKRVLSLVPFAAVALIATTSFLLRPYLGARLALHLVSFVVLALACHGELYHRRPKPARLTEFYLWTSFGGVIGGIFAGLIAPHLFNGIAEYPILILAAVLAMPGALAAGPGRFLRQSGPGLLLAALAVTLIWLVRVPAGAALPVGIGLILLIGALVLIRRQPGWFFGLAVLAFVTASLELAFPRIEQVRSFFGVHRVVEDNTGRFRLLLHGTTLHGAERVRNADGTPVTGRPEPTTYYYFGGPIGEAIAASRASQGRLDRVAAVGLGTGSLACHRHDGEVWTFFELDPQVVRIARDPTLFRFLSTCGADMRVVLGDARLTLTASPDRYDLIVLDAFSSDTIPVHLLTREAFAGYLSHLTAHGVIVLHISNQHTSLWRPAAAIGSAERLVAYGKGLLPADTVDEELRVPAEVVVFARDARDLGDLPGRPGWQRLDPDSGVAPWTDDYADVLGAILDRMLGR